MAAFNNLQGKLLKNGYKRRYFGGKKRSNRRGFFFAPLVAELQPRLVMDGLGKKSFQGLLCAHLFQVWSLLVWMDGWPADPHAASCDQAAVDAARPQSSLQGSFLFLGSQDCNDGLVEHRLQALLGQRRTFHIATCTNLKRRQKQKDSEKIWIRWQIHVESNFAFLQFRLFFSSPHLNNHDNEIQINCQVHLSKCKTAASRRRYRNKIRPLLIPQWGKLTCSPTII